MNRPESTVSPLARPPVQPMEAQLADDAICPQHRGLIARDGSGKDGTVYWCPIGRQYYRYRKDGAEQGFGTRLHYPKAGII